jgi:hypothetical protein
LGITGGIQMSENVDTINERRNRALNRYKSQLEWYERTKNDARRFFYLGQTLVILLTGITPLIILSTESKFWQALLPAAASIIAGVLGIWQFQEAWQRRAIALEALKSEFVKFDTRSGDDYRLPVTEDQAIDRFVLNIEGIVGNEVTQWQRQRGKIGKSSPSDRENS